MPSTPLFELFKWLFESSSQWSTDKLWDLVLHAPKYYEQWWTKLFHEAPQHVLIETSLVVFIIWLVFIRRTVDPKKSTEPSKLTPKEVQWLLETWEPEPLAPATTANEQSLVDNMMVIEKYDGDYLHIRGIDRKVLNTGSFDFLGFSQDESIKQVARNALDKYGCGSCGPRGFYGTIDQHLILEKDIADFMGTQEAICYSDGASATTSAIAAFAKKGDLLIVDEACSEPVMMGANLSRSTINYFKHNDMKDLRRVLEAVKADDKKYRRDTSQQRRFIIVDGLFRSTGNICPLPDLLAIKEEFFYRLFIDESMSFGVLGATGKGVTEHFDVPRSAVEIITIPLDTVLASVGGLCIGTREIVDHQRLSGAGYCYSASSAPFLCAAAIAGLHRLQNEAAVLLGDLRARTASMHAALSKLPHLEVVSHDVTPVVHLTLRGPAGRREDEKTALSQIAAACVQAGVAVVLSKHCVRFGTVRPSLMLCVHSTFSEEQVRQVAKVLDAVSRAALEGK